MHAENSEAENKIYMPTSSCEHGTRWNVSVLRTSGLNSDDQGCSCGLETPTLRAGLLTAGPPGLRTSHMPTPGRYALPIFFIAVGRCRVGDGESIAGEEVGESTPTTPECFHSGKAISFSAEEASQAGALADRRDQIRRLSGKWRRGFTAKCSTRHWSVVKMLVQQAEGWRRAS